MRPLSPVYLQFLDSHVFFLQFTHSRAEKLYFTFNAEGKFYFKFIKQEKVLIHLYICSLLYQLARFALLKIVEIVKIRAGYKNYIKVCLGSLSKVASTMVGTVELKNYALLQNPR